MHVFPLATTVLSEEQHHKELAYLVMFMVAFFAIVFILLLELRVRTLSADRFTAVLSTVQEGVITFDSDGKLEYVNPSALAMFDYKIKESCEEHPYTINGVERFLETKKVVINDVNDKPQYILSL